MDKTNDVEVRRVIGAEDRDAVLSVLSTTYLHEKHWATDIDALFPPEHLQLEDVAWFLAAKGKRPLGVLRVVFDPPPAAYAAYKLELLDKSLNVEDFLRRNRVAEIGRFAVSPGDRGKLIIPAALMRAATRETVARGCTYFVTDVLEDDPHSPYGFHTRVLGFQAVATHETGELLSKSRRITLILDISAAYRRLRARNGWIFRCLVSGWPGETNHGLAA